jgi:hypothetical protein
MKTFRILIAAVALLMVSTPNADAQLLKKLGNAAKRAAERVLEEKTEKTVEKAVDKATDLDTYKGNGQDEQQQGNNPAGVDAQGNPQVPAGQQGGQSLEMTYAKNDFVPGDEIIFDDPMDNEQLGEFPSMWDLKKGVFEIGTINGKKAIILGDKNAYNSTISPLMKDMKNYLPEKFTLEMDLWITKEINGNKDTRQEYHLHFYDTNGQEIMTLTNLNWGGGQISWAYRTTSGERVNGKAQFAINNDG